MRAIGVIGAVALAMTWAGAAWAQDADTRPMRPILFGLTAAELRSAAEAAGADVGQDLDDGGTVVTTLVFPGYPGVPPLSAYLVHCDEREGASTRTCDSVIYVLGGIDPPADPEEFARIQEAWLNSSVVEGELMMARVEKYGAGTTLEAVEDDVATFVETIAQNLAKAATSDW